MKRPVPLRPLALCLCMLLFSGCVFVSGPVDDGSRQNIRYDDANIKTDIYSALLKDNAAKANTINVYSYNGHIFLIGEADEAFQEKALEVARATEGVAHVTTHWFPKGTASTTLDAGIEEAVAKLVDSEEIKARRIAVDAWGGHVVLTGVARSQQDITSAVATIRKIPNVKSVTSYLVPVSPRNRQ